MAKQIVMNTPFLQLPAELRNHIYTAALTHDRANGQVAAVAFLRTCKQVHREAIGIFRAQSAFTIDMSCEAEDDEDNPEWVDNPVHIRMAGDVAMRKIDPSIMNFANLLPPEILQLDAIKVIVDLRTNSQRTTIYYRSNSSMNWLLYALVQLLNSDDKPRQLQFSYRDSDAADKFYSQPNQAYKYKYTFWPLKQLQRHIDLQLVDWNDKIEEWLRPMLAKRRPFSGVIRSAIEKYREVNAALVKPGIALHMGRMSGRNELLDDDDSSCVITRGMHEWVHEDLDKKLAKVKQLSWLT